jgi:hypothetical protein
MAQKVGQIARGATRTGLVRVYSGRDAEKKGRKHLNQKAYGGFAGRWG